MSSDWKRESGGDLDRKIRNIEKVQIKDKLAFLNQRIRALEKSFKETLETLGGGDAIGSSYRVRASFPEGEGGFEEDRRKERTKTVEDVRPVGKKAGKDDGTLFLNSYLREVGRDIRDSHHRVQKERGKDEVYREYIAESKLK